MNKSLRAISTFWVRLAVVAATIGATAGIAVASAPSAAAVEGCAVTKYYTVDPGIRISGVWNKVCTNSGITYFTVDIDKLENGQWVLVATGSGYAAYTCNGSAENEYRVFDEDEFDAACG
jgi:hypothetical protein